MLDEVFPGASPPSFLRRRIVSHLGFVPLPPSFLSLFQAPFTQQWTVWSCLSTLWYEGFLDRAVSASRSSLVSSSGHWVLGGYCGCDLSPPPTPANASRPAHSLPTSPSGPSWRDRIVLFPQVQRETVFEHECFFCTPVLFFCCLSYVNEGVVSKCVEWKSTSEDWICHNF